MGAVIFTFCNFILFKIFYIIYKILPIEMHKNLLSSLKTVLFSISFSHIMLLLAFTYCHGNFSM